VDPWASGDAEILVLAASLHTFSHRVANSKWGEGDDGKRVVDAAVRCVASVEAGW